MPTIGEVFADIVREVAVGAESVNGRELEQGAIAALLQRYYPWITHQGTDKEGNRVKTPQEVWDTSDGDLLKGKFREIGKRAALEAAATGNALIKEAETTAVYRKVEGESMCDWCRT